MEKTEFFNQNIFQNLANLNKDFDSNPVFYFSEADFEKVLDRIEQFGIGVYKIEARLKEAPFDMKSNEDYRKKATDPKWYKRAFYEFKKRQVNLEYTATYKVSEKLLNRKNNEKIAGSEG